METVRRARLALFPSQDQSDLKQEHFQNHGLHGHVRSQTNSESHALSFDFDSPNMELYKVPVYRRYIAGRVSCASCVRLVSLVVIILVPFFLAFVSHAFWRKEGVHYEQATVRFKHQAVVMTRGQDAGGAQSLIFSAVDADKFVSGSHVRAPMTRVRVGM